MIINTNMNALNAHRNMGINNAQAGKSMEKLSSGLRINRAGDDAAGLAISEKMRAQIKGLDQASRNSQDGISMVQTAEGALNETHNILQRMRELSVQAANDTNTKEDRTEIQKEITQLTSEINRIGNTTEFNNQKLLKGEDVSIKTSAQGVAGVTAAGATSTIEGITIGSHADNGGLGNIDVEMSVGTNNATTATYVGGKLTISIGTDSGEDDATKIEAAINGITTADGIDFSKFTATGTSTATTTVSKSSMTGGVTGVTAKTGTFELSGELKAGKIKIDNKELNITGTTQDELYASLATQINGDAQLAGKYGTVTYTTGSNKLDITQEVGEESSNAISATAGNKSFTMQVGANQNQTMTIEMGDMRAGALGITGSGAGFTSNATVTNGTDNIAAENALDVSDATNAGIAVTKIQDAINVVSSERSKMGAVQNRLEHTIANLGTSSENLTAAESRIRDVDMAKEMLNFSKNNILNQAAQSMLAQAKSQPEGVLQLLR